MEIPPISLGGITGTPYGVQVAKRIQYAVAQVISSHAGVDEAEVAKVLAQRIRGLGVNPNAREVTEIAAAIAKLPKVA